MASSISLVGVLVLVVFSAAVPGFFFELLSELIGGVDLADAGKANSADAVATEMLVLGFVRSGGDTSSCFSCCKLLPITCAAWNFAGRKVTRRNKYKISKIARFNATNVSD